MTGKEQKSIRDIALPGGVSVVPYETNEKRVVNDKIVSVEYHRIDWAKCFGGVL